MPNAQLSSFFESIADRLNLAPILRWLSTASPGGSLSITHAPGSSLAVTVWRISKQQSGNLVFFAPDADSAAGMASDLTTLGIEDILEFKPSSHHPYDDEQIVEAAAFTHRLDILNRIASENDLLIVTSPEAVYELVPETSLIDDRSLKVEPGSSVSMDAILDWLAETDFQRVDYVSEAGETAVRGGIVDVFPFTGDYPVRIEYFGDEIETIREFDIDSQRSISNLSSCRLVPGIDMLYHDMTRQQSFIDLLDPTSTTLVTLNEDIAYSEADKLLAVSQDAFTEFKDKFPVRANQPPEHLFQGGQSLRDSISKFTRLKAGSFSSQRSGEEVDLNCTPQPEFNSGIQLLRTFVASATSEIAILCDSKGQRQRLSELLEKEVSKNLVTLYVGSLSAGFILPDSVTVLTDHQIFNRFHRPSAKKRRSSGGLSIRTLHDLTPGDFVVHIDYGIGTYSGLKKITVRGKSQEAAQIVYKDRDTLYVNINAIHKLHKYSGKEGHHPSLTKLGTGQWERKKARTKKRVKDIARDLIKLYAQRRATDGHPFPPDTIWQREMEASFQYEDTPDQSTAVDLVKQDMMEPSPMDRLVCGDVGFGKTEVAIRAAFKAVQDGMQVAVLVPTTILAEQHHETFTKRLESFPVRVAALSRFRSPEEQKKILEDAAAGTIDILIGTHRITSKDVIFKSLGLLVIDEEQRFGVSVKEKLRKLKVNVDTLTLTATPIPRTLQFSLLGARDLSIMSTPPPNRQPILTEIHTFDTELIRDAIMYELNRGGQVFFIHNRVKSIEEMAGKLRDVIPDIRLRIAHGQMPPRKLENVMFDFKNHKFDVLVSTSIIENGLDISNANTIIINHANRFGLAEMHQLRGRVGRSDRKAFCYLLVSSIHSLTREAKQRLQALEEFSNLGAGFGLAMRDMDIRGAGNMLGAEQSGFIADVGFETYHKILDEAVSELRQDEFKELFHDKPVVPIFETTIDIDVDALIPTEYISSNNERLNIYRRISEAKESETVDSIVAELKDRFGQPPNVVANLIVASKLKLIGQTVHLQRITLKNERLFLTFPSQKESPHFHQHIFKPLMEWLSKLDNRFVMKESKRGTIRAIIQDVKTLDVAMKLSTDLETCFSVAKTPK